MKKGYSFLIGLAALALPVATQTCHLSHFHLISEQNLGGNVYQYTVEFCVGSGREGYNYGAVGYTGSWAVKLDNGAAFDNYPATATSPSTGAVLLASLFYGSDILLYDNTYAAPGWDGTWACIEPS